MKKQFIKRMIVSAGLLALVPAAQALAQNNNNSVIKSVSIPTCHMRSNDAAISALQHAEKQAIQACGNPVWLTRVNIQVNSPNAQNTCGSVTATAEYLCR